MTLGILLLNPLLSPSYGLIVWTLLAFGIVLFLLKKLAWKPILKSLQEREDSIQNALDTAKKAREEMGLANIKVMIPMCRTVEEGKKVLKEMALNGLAQHKNGL